MSVTARTLVLVILLTVLGVAADTALKSASLSRHPFTSPWFFLGCALSCGFAVVWVLLMHSMKLATAGIIYAIASTLLLIVVGTVFFGERLATRELAGIAMALGALALLGRATPA